MGEISKQDEFGLALYKTIKSYNLGRILEIGSWDGTGSTRCIIDAISELELKHIKRLVCLEINKDRFTQLVKNTKQYEWVECYNETSISYNQLYEKDFNKIWDSPFNGLKKHPTAATREQAEKWFNDDVRNLKKAETSFLDADDSFYDGVLIDGGEFFGYSEFKILKDRTNILFLDDYYYGYKTNQVARELLQDTEWDVIAGNKNLRNGYAIFKRKTFLDK